MKPFTDSANRTWNVVVNVHAVKRVRDLLNIDLLDVANGELLSRLVDDPCLLADVLYAVLKPDADAKGVNAQDFGAAMVGAALDDGSAALMKELLDFFPSAQRARALGRMIRKIGEQEKAIAEAAAAIRSMPGASSGSSPASSESTPATSPSATS